MEQIIAPVFALTASCSKLAKLELALSEVEFAGDILVQIPGYL